MSKRWPFSHCMGLSSAPTVLDHSCLFVFLLLWSFFPFFTRCWKIENTKRKRNKLWHVTAEWLHNNSALCVLLQWRQEAKLHSSLLTGKTEWVSISISHQCLSLPQSKAAVVSRAELMGINRNKQNKTRHHQCCCVLSFFTSIIPSLF